MNAPHPTAAAARTALPRHGPAEPDPAVGGAACAGAAAAGQPLRPGAVALRRGAALPDARRRGHHRRGGGAARADPGEPGAARPVGGHAVAVRRPAVDPARRSGAQPPPHAKRAALHRRRLGGLHRGRRRAHHHAAGRLHHHARAGPGTTTGTRATGRWSGWTAWTSRWSASSTPASRKTTPASRRRCTAHGRHELRALRPQHGAGAATTRPSAPRRRSSAIPTSAAAKRWSAWSATRPSTTGTASSCAT